LAKFRERSKEGEESERNNFDIRFAERGLKLERERQTSQREEATTWTNV
jgi:hypothetical protein